MISAETNGLKPNEIGYNCDAITPQPHLQGP